MKKNILIVENDEFWSKQYAKLLKEFYNCKAVDSYLSAVKYLKRSAPYALILDLKLGDTSINEEWWEGWLLAETAKKSKISSIIVTGYPDYSKASRAFRDFNVIDFFSKTDFPEINTRFVKRIQEAVELTEKKRQKKTPNGGILDNSPVKKSVFISYSHQNRDWLDRFKKNLKVLERTNQLTIWDDTKIKSGNKWKVEIKNALASASVALLLVTPDFLASDFITNTELPVLFRAAKRKGLRILWVAVEPSLYDETVICDFQATNAPNKPLSTLPKAKADQEIIKICKLVKEAASP
jgi:ActR/RegA family two-component response regulator